MKRWFPLFLWLLSSLTLGACAAPPMDALPSDTPPATRTQKEPATRTLTLPESRWEQLPERLVLHPLPARFQRGVCLAHSYQNNGAKGYGTDASRTSKQALKEIRA